MNTFRESIPHPKLVQLYDYWDSIRGNRIMPGRRDMDPLDIPKLLANIVLYDVERAPLRFRIRLYGTALTNVSGTDITGRYLDEPGISRISSLICPANEIVASTGNPHLLEAPYPPKSGNNGFIYRICLPLSDDGEQVSMLLIGFFLEKLAITTKHRQVAVA